MSIKAIILEAVLTIIVFSFIGYQYHVSALDGSKHISQGQTLLVHRDYEQARDSFIRAMADINRSNGAMFFAKGMTLDKTQNLADALHGLGCAYAGLGQHEDANDCLTAVLQSNAFYVHSRAKRAEVRCDLGDYQGAISDYTQILVSAPNAAHTYYARGVANARIENHAQAIEDLTKAIELLDSPSHQYERLHFTNSLARLLATCPDLQYRDGDKAVTLAEEIVATAHSTFDKDSGAETLARFKSTLATAYSETGRAKEALAQLQQAAALLEEAGADPNEIGALRSRLAVYESTQPAVSVD